MNENLIRACRLRRQLISRAAHAAVRAGSGSRRHAGAIGAAIRDDDLPAALPADALDDRIAIVGTAGSGKTYAAKGFVERLLNTGARVTIVDPLGVWWGLRASADGSAAGYPVVVFGGRHADVPIAAELGAARLRRRLRCCALLPHGPFPTVVSPAAIWGQVRMGMRLSMSECALLSTLMRSGLP